MNVTGSPDDAVAAAVTGEAMIDVAVRAGKEIVWAALLTMNVRLTSGAAANVALPGWEATTVQLPAATRVIVLPLVRLYRLDVQTSGVVVVNATANPDDAVPATVTGVWISVFVASVPNEIVCASRTSRLAVAVKPSTVAVTVWRPTAPPEQAAPVTSRQVPP